MKQCSFTHFKTEKSKRNEIGYEDSIRVVQTLLARDDFLSDIFRNGPEISSGSNLLFRCLNFALFESSVHSLC